MTHHPALADFPKTRSLNRRLCLLVLGIVWAGTQTWSAQAPPTPADRSAETKPHRKGFDRYDLRAAEDAGRSEKLALVRKSFERQRWDEGAIQLQSLFEEGQDSLVFEQDRRWRPITEIATELIRQFPDDARQAYEARFLKLAERDLNQARQSRDLVGLIRVSQRYLLTTAGQLACRDLIDAAIDQGNADAIAQQVRNLLRVDSPQLRDGAWLGVVLEVLRESGQASLVADLAQKLAVSPPLNASASPWTINHFGAAPTAVSDWPTLAGSATGQKRSEVQESTRLPRWRQTLVAHPWVRRLLQEQGLAFRDEGVLGLSVLSAVGSGDVVVTRTLSDLTAVNAQTGQVLWQSREWGLPPDLSAESGDVEIELANQLNSTSDNPLAYRLRQRLTTNGSLGMLSADTQRIYALASFGLEDPPWKNVIQPSFEESAGGMTYLYARDLHSGRVVWRAGGPRVEEPPGLPADGTFFFGPPTPSGDELFVVGERDGDILLLCLEAGTGFVRWEQLLAAAGRRLDSDAVRRSWTAPVAVRGSLVVCPTTTGWLVAIDRVSRKFVWSVRLVPRGPNDPETNESELAFDNSNRDGGVDERWPPLQPILLRDRVIVAPIEFPDEVGSTQPRLYCLDLNSGEQLWELSKDQYVGVIGASEELVYLFNRFSICAVSTSTGATIWTCSIDDSVAGRPLLTQSEVVVPTLAGTLLRVSLDSGELIDDQPADVIPLPVPMRARLLNPAQPEELALGNLLSLGGRIVSVSSLEMIAFEWQADEARWQAAAPTDAASALRWAQSQAQRGQFAEAVQTLRQSAPLAMADPKLATRHQQTLSAVLYLQLQSELKGPIPTHPVDREGLGSRLVELQQLASTPRDREEVRRLAIDLALHTEDWDAAWSLIREALQTPLLVPVEIDDRIVSPDAWLADRILRLAQIPDRARGDTQRTAIRSEFQSLWSTSLAVPASRERLLRLFAETPFADAAELDSLKGGQDPLELTKLLALTHSRDLTTAKRASLQLIERLAVPDWVGEARRRFAALPPAAEWPQDLLAARAAAEQKLIGILDTHQGSAPSWVGVPLEMKRQTQDGTDLQQELPVVWIGEPCEALKNFRYFYDHTLQFVSMERVDGSRYGELLLASNDENPLEESPPVLYGSGLNLYLVHMGAIHAFSVPEKRLLWRRNTDNETGYDPRLNPRDEVDRNCLKTLHSLTLNHSDANTGSGVMVFEVANSRQVVTRTRRGIEVLDAMTGLVQWSQPRCPITTVRCDEDRICRLTGNEAQVSSIRSGRSIVAPDLSEFQEQMTPLDEIGITTIQERPGDGLTWQMEGLRFRAEPIAGRTLADKERWDEQDLVRLETVWTQSVAADCLLGPGPPGHGVWLEQDGNVQLIDWSNGQTKSLGIADLGGETESPFDDPKREVFVYWERSRMLVLSSLKDQPTSIDGPALPAAGTLSAHSREQSTRLWSASTDGILLMHSLSLSPFLPILRLEDVQVAGLSCQRVHLTLLDKATGQVVHEIHTPTFGMGASGCHYDPLRRRWKLVLAGERIQLQPGPTPPLK